MSNHDAPPDIASFSSENQEIVTVLRGDDDEARLDLLQDLGEVDDELADELLRLLHSAAAEEVRAAAAIALGPSLELCDNEVDEEGRLESDVAGLGVSAAPLSQTGYDRVLEELRRVHLDPGVPELVRRRVLEAAVRSPQEWQLRSIRAAWTGDNPDWRVTAVFCMGYYYRADFAREIEQAFRSGSEDLRREAMLAAAQRGLTDLAPAVTAIARDPRAPLELRYAAVEALGDLGGSDEVALLEELCESADETLAEIAEAALEELHMTLELNDLDALDDDLDDES